MSSLDNRRAGWVGVLGSPRHWAQAPATLYVQELLGQVGLLNWRWVSGPDEWADPQVRVLVIPNGRLLGEADVEPVRTFVQAGGSLLVLGRPGPLAELFNVRPQPPLLEGWLVAGPQAEPPFSAACPVPLHVFDVVQLLPGQGATGSPAPRSPVHFSVGNHAVHWPASTEVTVGAGRALLLSADLVGSIVRIQQGLAVHRDGESAPDGSADLRDGVLKCEDSILLDWTRDRQQPVEPFCPIFLQPQCDLLRELLWAAIAHLAAAAGTHLVRLANWPRGLPAVGLISHNSDLNEEAKADFELAGDGEADVRACWCVMSGTADGAVSEYSPQMLARIAASGHEIALCYDAKTDHPACRWGLQSLRDQLDRLRQRMRAVGIDAAVYSNKNYFTRWEGRLEFFRWLADLGVRVDQSKGPTKRGALGWPFGTCHPWQPIDDEITPPCLVDLMEIGFASPDLGGQTCPVQLGRHFIDVAAARGGVAHLLFHPWQADRAELRRNLADHVAYGRAKGLEWWTSRQIGIWQFARRAVRLRQWAVAEGKANLSLETAQPLEGAVIEWIAPGRAIAGPPTTLAGPGELELGER